MGGEGIWVAPLAGTRRGKDPHGAPCPKKGGGGQGEAFGGLRGGLAKIFPQRALGFFKFKKILKFVSFIYPFPKNSEKTRKWGK